MGLGLESNAAEGADAEVERIVGVGRAAIREVQEPSNAANELSGRPVERINKRLCAGVERSQCGLRWVGSSPVAIALRYCVDICARACVVYPRARLQIEVSNV